MASGIPKTYSVLFTLLDPLIALWGTSLFLLSPQTVTSSYLPDSYTRPLPWTLRPLTRRRQPPEPLGPPGVLPPLHAQIAGHLLSNALLSFLLLRAAPDNLRIWRVYQLSLLLVDGFLLYGTFASYGIQGRLSPWRGASRTGAPWASRRWRGGKGCVLVASWLSKAGEGKEGVMGWIANDSHDKRRHHVRFDFLYSMAK
ncbi:beta-mannosidase MndA [Colletotrichum tofieldiae]|nr:beta-mannosidase MndA [Colletotrichum tofieldiae]